MLETQKWHFGVSYLSDESKENQYWGFDIMTSQYNIDLEIL